MKALTKKINVAARMLIKTLVVALEIPIIIEDIMITSDMKNAIVVLADRIIVKTSMHVDMTTITIIARLQMVTRSIMTRIARKKIMQCTTMTFPILVQKARVNFQVTLTQLPLLNLQAANGHLMTTMLILICITHYQYHR